MFSFWETGKIASGILCAAATLGAAIALSTRASAADCSEGTLGVSRTITVDTAKDKRFGEPFGNPDFLAKGEVVLTFDDGPAPRFTRPILAALAAQCTKATFFSVGRMAAEHGDVVKEIIAQGHTIGGHTWSHANLKRLPEDAAKRQIESAFNALERSAAGGTVAPFFRFPYLSESDAALAHLARRNIGTFAIDVDSFDWRNRDPGTIVRRIMGGLHKRGRGIVLLHDIHATTAAAVPRLLAELKKDGFRVVHLAPAAPVQTLSEFQPPEKPAPQHVAHARPRRSAITRVHTVR